MLVRRDKGKGERLNRGRPSYHKEGVNSNTLVIYMRAEKRLLNTINQVFSQSHTILVTINQVFSQSQLVEAMLALVLSVSASGSDTRTVSTCCDHTFLNTINQVFSQSQQSAAIQLTGPETVSSGGKSRWDLRELSWPLACIGGVCSRDLLNPSGLIGTDEIGAPLESSVVAGTRGRVTVRTLKSFGSSHAEQTDAFVTIKIPDLGEGFLKLSGQLEKSLSKTVEGFLKLSGQLEKYQSKTVEQKDFSNCLVNLKNMPKTVEGFLKLSGQLEKYQSKTVEQKDFSNCLVNLKNL
ncbi:hypothetical protein RRG08_058233 [Elysia crispata]|uniref:Uncharacterized protein n=1 Tax=Elysia crispata TaxID=231223 RepID=A0AAE0YVP4_9GAST|nr:hypothetical protein RRG08_058233 [Elysia crispata]